MKIEGAPFGLVPSYTRVTGQPYDFIFVEPRFIDPDRWYLDPAQPKYHTAKSWTRYKAFAKKDTAMWNQRTLTLAKGTST